MNTTVAALIFLPCAPIAMAVCCWLDRRREERRRAEEFAELDRRREERRRAEEFAEQIEYWMIVRRHG